jgi:hypothetical protein
VRLVGPRVPAAIAPRQNLRCPIWLHGRGRFEFNAAPHARLSLSVHF